MALQILSLAGAVLILIAFAANQFEKMSRETMTYQLLNLIGGAALFITAVASRQYGFILMEGSWVLVSAWALFQLMRKPTSGLQRH